MADASTGYLDASTLREKKGEKVSSPIKKGERKKRKRTVPLYYSLRRKWGGEGLRLFPP